MKEEKIILVLLLMLVIIPFCSSITINHGTIFNTTISHSAITFGITVNVDTIEVENNYIYLTGISYTYSGTSYSCTSYNHSQANTTINAYQLCMTESSSGSGDTTTQTQQPGGGTSIYYISENQLEKGYVKKLKENQKVIFDFNDEEKTIMVKEVSKGSVIISVDGKDYSIDMNSVEKINFDGDNYYDFEISFLNSDGTQAEMIFKMISEEIVSEKEEEKESPAKEYGGEKENFYLYVLVIFIVALFILIGLKKRRKR